MSYPGKQIEARNELIGGLVGAYAAESSASRAAGYGVEAVCRTAEVRDSGAVLI